MAREFFMLTTRQCYVSWILFCFVFWHIQVALNSTNLVPWHFGCCTTYLLLYFLSLTAKSLFCSKLILFLTLSWNFSLVESYSIIDLAANTGKTKFMVIVHHWGIMAREHIRIGCNSYEKVKSFKYLGSLLTNKILFRRK